MCTAHVTKLGANTLWEVDIMSYQDSVPLGLEVMSICQHELDVILISKKKSTLAVSLTRRV